MTENSVTENQVAVYDGKSPSEEIAKCLFPCLLFVMSLPLLVYAVIKIHIAWINRHGNRNLRLIRQDPPYYSGVPQSGTIPPPPSTRTKDTQIPMGADGQNNVK